MKGGFQSWLKRVGPETKAPVLVANEPLGLQKSCDTETSHVGGESRERREREERGNLTVSDTERMTRRNVLH